MATNEHFIPLTGLNSIGDEQYADMSADGQTIVFQSNRSGDDDNYVWRAEQGLLDLPNLNSAQVDHNPSLNGDGNLIAFESLRNGQADVLLYDLNAGTFIELPNLNTVFPEEYPTLNAEGTLLAYTSRRDAHNSSADTYLYDLTTQRPQGLDSGWFNTNADELRPTLNGPGSLVAFEGRGRADGKSGPDGGGPGPGNVDIYLYNLNRNRLLNFPNLQSRFSEGDAALSADGNFLAFYSNRYDPSMLHLGNDILLMELDSGELLALPCLNSEYEEGGPVLTANAEYVLFHSKRPGGEGGYDLYLYHRDIEDTTEYVTTEVFNEDGYVTNSQGKPLANGDGNVVSTATTDAVGNFIMTIPVGTKLPIKYSTENGKVVTDDVGDDTYVPDFEAGNLKFTQVWVEDTLQAGMPSKIWFDVETEMPKYNTFVKLYLVNLPTGSVDDLDVSGGDFKVDYTLTALSIDQLGQIGPGDSVTHNQGADIVTETSYLTDDNRKVHVEHSFIVPAEVADGTYAAVFSIGRFDISS